MSWERPGDGLATLGVGRLTPHERLLTERNHSEWAFRPEKLGVQRLRLLQQADSYSAIAHRIAGEMTGIQFRGKKGNKEAKNKKRAEFFFDVEAETLDGFFNGSQGYRAQYYVEPQRGIECTRFVLELCRQLIEAASQSNQGVMTLEQVKKSLQCEISKKWMMRIIQPWIKSVVAPQKS